MPLKNLPPPEDPRGPEPLEGQERERLRARLDPAPPSPDESATALLGMIAHELRSPLQALTVNVQLTAERVTADAEVPRAWLLARLETQQRATARLGRLCEIFLEVAEGTEGRRPVAAAAADLRDVAAEAIAGAATDLAWAGCACELRAPTSVPGRWDRGRLEIVTSNLLSNAMKFGAGRPIVVEVAGAGPSATLNVRDQGGGIAPEHHAHIFDKFARLPSSPVIPGVGLGLWIVRRFVAAMGGTIQVQSALGRGATFTVTLPREPPPAGA